VALDYSAIWAQAVPWSQFFHPAMDLFALWDGVYRHAAAPAWAVESARRLAPPRLLAISHDWCWDAANTLPWVARLAEAGGGELRIALRDENPDLMDEYLTDGARSIPVVIALDEAFRVRGRWGPRPAELQAWFLANRATMPKEERYAHMRRWYIRDKGESTLREMLAAMEPRR
jgi:thioredoxin-like negative regulator of GroEL